VMSAEENVGSANMQINGEGLAWRRLAAMSAVSAWLNQLDRSSVSDYSLSISVMLISHLDLTLMMPSVRCDEMLKLGALRVWKRKKIDCDSI